MWLRSINRASTFNVSSASNCIFSTFFCICCNKNTSPISSTAKSSEAYRKKKAVPRPIGERFMFHRLGRRESVFHWYMASCKLKEFNYKPLSMFTPATASFFGGIPVALLEKINMLLVRISWPIEFCEAKYNHIATVILFNNPHITLRLLALITLQIIAMIITRLFTLLIIRLFIYIFYRRKQREIKTPDKLKG